MNICFVGNGRSVHLRKFLDWFAGHGHTVSLIGEDPPAVHEIRTINTMPLYSRAIGFPYLPGYVSRMGWWKKHFNKLNADIVHVHYPSGGYRVHAALAGFIPTVVSVWGSDIIDHPEVARRRLERFMVRRALGKAHAVTAVSRWLSEHAEKFCSRRRLHTLAFGVDTSLFDPEEYKQPARSEHAPRILFAKRLMKVSGADIVPAVAEIVTSRVPGARFTIAGAGPLEDFLKKETAEKNLPIDFAGQVENSRMPRLLSGHDIFFMPSRRESFGIAALEAQAMRMPVVGADVDGISEAVMNNATGLLVPPGDVNALAEAIVELIRDPDRRSEMGKEGRKQVESRYTLDACMSRFESLYRGLTIPIEPGKEGKPA